MAFNDYKKFLSPLKLPIDGVTYVIPEISAKLGIKLALVMEEAQRLTEIHEKWAEKVAQAEKDGTEPPEKPNLDAEGLEAEEVTDEEMLGDAYQQMLDNDVPKKVVTVASSTVMWDYLYGREAAESFWNSGGDPKAIAKLLPDLSKPKTTSGGEETTTRKRASTSGTKSRTKSSRNTTGASKKSGTRKS
ncbi:hypothetical protein QDX21_07050 [Auritidibacter ignavus]|uniref:DUF7426 domain-containing protein n=1 Tax=Auritidibacter ignavus TaxID=678932 RepID=A0AAJ6AG49_9MICC|nr:hypothetical protein [Auritidibacter ignavus]WGH92092.1 hypothetical protein QDX21_07050 [Auritidibacter ignavus]